MYCYKIKVSIKKESNEFEECNEKLALLLKKTELIPLENNEYGTDNYATGMALVQELGRQAWFLDNAEELIWFNGEDYDEIGDYYEEDALKYFLNKKNERN